MQNGRYVGETIRLHRCSAGLELQALRAGRDILLAVDPAHGLELPRGTLIDDYLDLELRAGIDAAAAEALRRWRDVHDGPLTGEGICLPWLWEIELYASVFLPAAREAVGLRQALAAHGWPAVELPTDDESLGELVEAAGGSVAPTGHPGPPAAPQRAPERADLAKRLRAAVIAAARYTGLPSLLRRRAVVVWGYWQMAPLVDRMLANRRLDPALAVQALPPGSGRSLRMAARGGWVGLPGPLQRRAAARLAARLREEIVAIPLDLLDCALGKLIYPAACRFVAERAAHDLADARLLGGRFRRSEVGAIVVPFDVVPETRLLVKIAQSFAIPTIVVQHGGYLEAERFPDLRVADTVALWSEAALPAVGERADHASIVGYPGAVQPRRKPRARSPYTITVLGDGAWRVSTLRDGRIMQQHYLAAIEGSAKAVPEPLIVLRPHPSFAAGAAEAICERYPHLRIEVDRTTTILELLARSDVCIGTYSTASLQAALVDTPTVVLNLGGTDFPWPLGGKTTVPVAHSRDELASILERLVAGEGGQGGREELLAALGVVPGDAIERVHELIARQLGDASSARGGRPRTPHKWLAGKPSRPRPTATGR